MPTDITDAAARSAKASKTLDTMRARIVKADEARAAQVAAAAINATAAPGTQWCHRCAATRVGESVIARAPAPDATSW